MKEKIKNILALVLLVLLLPYVITVVMSGKLRQTYLPSGGDNSFISVEADGKVKEVNFEDYVMGVTALQIPTGYDKEAVKAQMIIVRTNLRRQLEENPQVLLSEQYLSTDKLEELGILDRMNEAEMATRGQILTYDSKPIMASYHAISAGKTRDGTDVFHSSDYPYLTTADSSKDVQAKRFLHVSVLEPEMILESCKAQYPNMKVPAPKGSTNKETGELTPENLWENMEILSRDRADYVKEIRIGDTLIPGEEFRKFLNLNSSCFTMEQVNGKIQITTKGLGHGVGLSQFGAERLAQAGKTKEEILAYYYKGVAIENIYIDKSEKDNLNNENLKKEIQ